ncbi:MAG: C25 family cysteine peptidase [Acidobacteria bacterium]|jgi:PKD repeat protein|nr:C25 family cysteine peptidase [Acidobacteriota bacterium]
MKNFKHFVLFLVFFGLTFTVFGANKSTLISNSAYDTTFTFTLESYDFEHVQTSQGESVIVTAPHSGRIMEAGAPDLAKFSTAVIIPDKGKMGIEVIDGQYTDLENVSIAPSKGNLLRKQDPNLVPYVYGKNYKKNAFFPGSLAELNKPYIARDLRGQAAILYPFQYNPVTKTLRVYNSLTVKVYKKGNTGENEFNRNKPLKTKEIVREFNNVYGRHFINFNAVKQEETPDSSLQYVPLQDPLGRMLIVCHAAFIPNMTNFVNYKQSIGYTVDLVDYSTIGSAAALKDYVANDYFTYGLTYLLLVGDHAQVPVSSTDAGDSDNNYGYIVGDDHYQDIFVGRFSAETAAQVDTQVNRTIYYERDLSPEAAWFRNTTGMGSSDGPGHNGEFDFQHINNILMDLMGYGYNASSNHQAGGTTVNLTNLINAGKGTLWYCGHGNIDGWYCGWNFLNANVQALTNDNMLPAIFSVACQVGNFRNNTCFCEFWLRETNGANPTGAIAHAGSTINQSWNPPMDAQDEMCDLLVSAGGPKRTFGGVFVNGLFRMNDLNGAAGYSMTDTWVCFGDSSVQLRTPGTPDGPVIVPVAPVANFTGTPTTVSRGNAVNYTDTSTGSPTGWFWSFEGGTPATSTAQNPAVVYNTAGTFDVTLIAYNDAGSDMEFKSNYISVPLYCLSQGTSQTYEWISRVCIANLDNNSGASQYSNFVARVANLTRGNAANVTLFSGYSGALYTEYWRIWIDYNKDGDFADAGEQVFENFGSVSVNGSFVVPGAASVGNTRMRVSMRYGVYPSYCGTFNYGEVEDYTAAIQ